MSFFTLIDENVGLLRQDFLLSQLSDLLIVDIIPLHYNIVYFFASPNYTVVVTLF
jgi:hypothetical protein